MSSMLRLVRIECSKALKNRWFHIALGIACALALISAIGNIAFHQANGVTQLYEHKYVSPSPDSCYRYWISLDFLQPTSTLLYQLLPLLAVIPHAWSLGAELKSGYIAQTYSRTSRRRYAVAKHLSCAASASLIAIVPIALNFILLACFIPAYQPDVYEVIYLGVYEDMLWSELFYTQPVVYIILYTILPGIICALWAGFVMALSYFVGNRVILIAAPYLFLFIVQFINDRIFLAAGNLTGFQLGLGNNMRAGTDVHLQVGWVIALECAMLALGAIALIAVGNKKDVV